MKTKFSYNDNLIYIFNSFIDNYFLGIKLNRNIQKFQYAVICI